MFCFAYKLFLVKQTFSGFNFLLLIELFHSFKVIESFVFYSYLDIENFSSVGETSLLPSSVLLFFVVLVCYF